MTASLQLHWMTEVKRTAAVACGPTYCLDTPEYGKVLAQRIAASKADASPNRLIALYD
ncbi:hypothetical protein [Caballeronia sp. dw_276]|uniref:hypothetical protein n=1 Tax=Caballeronia sp. dw_276 TaxID=2719795 RepID=UPI001BD2545F|nr:hypothetical protein [Caballeronia sp. dw_276]